jgi:5-(carboxyamino)imidazole ribonucleotide mutase
MSQKNFVAILMGSDSDLEVMRACENTLKQLDIPSEINILSAHRTPEATKAYIVNAQSRGCQVFVAAAGMAAHLAGVVAAHTIKPVIGVPLSASALGGMDALLSTAQMPGGIPVACMAIGKAGAKNAAYLAAQMLAIHDEGVADTLRKDRQAMTAAVLEKNDQLH